MLFFVAADSLSAQSCLLGLGSGFPVPSRTLNFDTGDFNEDGMADLVLLAGRPRDYSVTLHFGTSSGLSPQSTSVVSGLAHFYTLLLVTDVDRDGHDDVILAVEWGDHVEVYLGDGTGLFASPITTVVSDVVTCLIEADLNADQQPYLLTGARSLLLGSGEGRFVERLDEDIWFPSESAAPGDFDGDGHLDVAFASLSMGGVFVLLGDGTGDLSAPVHSETFSWVMDVVTADLDGDNILDLVVSWNEGRSVSLLRGAGDGTFDLVDPALWNRDVGTRSNLAVTADLVTTNLAVTDLDEDGHLDILIATDDGLVVFHRFGERVELSTPSPAGRILAGADFNGDGHSDVGMLVDSGRSIEFVVLSNGLGLTASELDCNQNDIPDGCDLSLGVSLDCNVNGVPDECDISSGEEADCNENDIPDSCESDCNGNGVPDECDLRSRESSDCNGNGLPDECDIASRFSFDCNRNGVPDSCDISSGASRDCNHNGVPDSCDRELNLDIYREYVTDLMPGCGSYLSDLCVADLDDNGQSDIVVSVDATCRGAEHVGELGDSDEIMVFLNAGTSDERSLTLDFEEDVRAVVAADFTGDDIVDLLAVLGERILLFPGQGDGQFAEASTQPVGYIIDSLKVADIDGDGRLDLLARPFWSVLVHVHLGIEGGHFADPISVEASSPTIPDFVVVDVNGDQIADIVTADFSSRSLSIFHGDGASGFLERRSVDVGDRPYRIHVADLGNDGDADLIVATRDAPSVVICFENDGNGQLSATQHLAVGRGRIETRLGDLDGDQQDDLVVLNRELPDGDRPGAAYVSVFRGRQDGVFDDLPRHIAVHDSGDRFISRTHLEIDDMNQDGELDLVIGLAVRHDETESVVKIVSVVTEEPPESCVDEFQRGDWNSDGDVDVSDAVFGLNALFLDINQPECRRAADADDDGELNITDPIFILRFLFAGGATPPAPFPECGQDPTFDELSCGPTAVCE